nr:CAP domain-containing protein [Paenibacillus turpanensis]
MVAAISMLPQAASANAQPTHIVKAGDSIWSIAVQYKVSFSKLLQANPKLLNPNLIYPGQSVTIPAAASQPVSPAPAAPQPAPTGAPATAAADSIEAWEKQVSDLVNQERAKAGLNPLTLDVKLSGVARAKSADMMNNKYFSHQSPTYGSPFEMMKSFGITYRAAGENIAAGQTSPQAVVTAWMNSPGHRANILSDKFTSIGVGLTKGGSYRYYWTQMFIGK